MNFWFNTRQRVIAHKLAYILVSAGIVIGLIILLLIKVLTGNGASPSNQFADPKQSTDPKKYITREFNGSEWSAQTAAPDCPNPLTLNSPIDVSLATGTIWPGQRRRSDYKPHGGIRFDGAPTNSVEVTAPIEGYLVMAARYLVDGEVQYTLDFIHPCGIMYRLGHLRELTPKFAAVAEGLPTPQEGNSGGHFVEPVFVPAGEQIATKTGFIGSKNIFFDFGVYDLRQKNKSSQDAVWAVAHAPEHAHYAVCWFDLLPQADADILKSLPTGIEGKVSDYCP